MKSYYAIGYWNIDCMVCGMRKKSGDIKKRWDGMLTCTSCYETRHPMDFLRARQERLSVPFTYQMSNDNFTDVEYLDGIADDLVFVEDQHIIDLQQDPLTLEEALPADPLNYDQSIPDSTLPIPPDGDPVE